MARLYGSIHNRFEEGHNFTGKDIEPGTDITMYFYSDRRPYFVTEVINQKDIKVKEYFYCGDHSKKLDYGHNDWVYFKTADEYNKYLNSYGFNSNVEENKEEEWVFRYGKWKEKVVYSKDSWNSKREKIAEMFKDKDWSDDDIDKETYWNYFRGLTEEEFEDIKNGVRDITKYYDLSGKISFGKAEYYYDPSF